MNLSKGYIVIFSILIALPVLIAATVLCYTCFKLSTLAGFIAIGVCLLSIAVAAIVVVKKSKVTK